MINHSNITSIYVSQKYGNDGSPGFSRYNTEELQGPIKSIEKALEKVAELRRIGANQPISIILTDDIHRIEKPIKIDNSVNSVTIKSSKNTLISGGFRITGFKDDTFNGVSCFSADVPEIDEGIWFTDLYVDGKRADFTSYPKEGLLKPDSVENESTRLSASSKWFIAKKEDIADFKNFKNFGDCFISYNHYWIDEHTPIESYDLETGKIVFSYPSRFTIELTHPASALEYKVENVAETFSNKNEWYLDRETKKVYYIPRDESQTAESIEVYAPLTDKLFIIEGEKEKNVESIIFQNLTFANTKGDYRSIIRSLNSETGEMVIDETGNGYASDAQAVSYAYGAIEFFYAHNCAIENCTLRNLGVHAITVNHGCSNIRICCNNIYDIAAGGIKINGGAVRSEKCEHTHNITVSDNVITACGKRYFAACGILVMHAYENTISHNTISDLYYTGISIGWVWGYKDNITRDNLIEKNHIFNIGQGKLSDMGGVYLLGKQPGTIVRNNLIHDVVSAHYGGWALYTDEGSSYITLEKNICYNTTNNAFHQHYGCMNTVRNNIFAKSGKMPVNVTRSEMHNGVICEKNIITSEDQPSYVVGYVPEARGSFQVLSGRDNLHYNFKGETIISNVGEKSYKLEEFKNTFGFEEGSIITNPMFKDYENNDYTLSPDSPAYALGFEEIDMSDVGARVKK